MTETLYFPGLGLEFELNKVAFTIASMNIYWYGIIMGVAFLLGMLYVFKRVHEFGVDSDRMIDVLFGSVISAIIGARLYFVAFSWDNYKDNLMDIFSIREGGIAIYGGVIAAFLAGYLLCKWRKVKVLPAIDCAVGGLFIGQAVGRWGNFVNIEAFGGNTSMPWGMTSNSIANYLQMNQASLADIGMKIDPSLPVHPTFFYESIWCIIGFFFVVWYTKRRKFDGELLLFYLSWYGLGRFFIEGLRTDSLMISTIRASQLFALITCISAVIIWMNIRYKLKNDPEYKVLYVNTDEAKMVLSGEFYKKAPKDQPSLDEAVGDALTYDKCGARTLDESVYSSDAEEENNDKTVENEEAQIVEDMLSDEEDEDGKNN